MPAPKYKVFADKSTLCNDCGNWVNLLAPEHLPYDIDAVPAFYVCPKCGSIGQVGVGRIRKGRPTTNAADLAAPSNPSAQAETPNR